MIAWAGLILAGGGLYVIYQHKESMGKNHYTTYHSWGESVIESIHHDYLCLQVLIHMAFGTFGIVLFRQ